MKKYIFASVVGNSLEWYDFVIFGYFSPIFSQQFFPADSPLASMINIFIIFALGLLSRPLGAYLFGRIADKEGRKKSLMISVILMGISTSCIGCLPAYESIGLMAPFLLTILRLLQGISLGGEFTSSITFLTEHAPPSQRGYAGSWVTFGGVLGSAMGLAVATLTSIFLSSDDLHTWGWRLPFLLGIGVAYLGLHLRNSVEETPLFLSLKQRNAIEINPFKTALTQYAPQMRFLIALLMPANVWSYLLFVFMPTYLTRIKNWEFSTSLMINVLPIVISLMLFPYIGHLSDQWGRKKIISLGFIFLCLATPLTFFVVNNGTLMHIMLLQSFIAFALVLVDAPAAALMAELFPTQVRSCGISIPYHLSAGIFGGLTPLILTSLITFTGNLVAPSLYLLASTIVGLVVILNLEETHPIAVLS